ncbi:hypothetical protein MIR68_010121 [Amoeboaphelidium protococcarum]|nr:hypothetical protein MIR68_010121 [Amoeboaphelidium protococcarum]
MVENMIEDERLTRSNGARNDNFQDDLNRVQSAEDGLYLDSLISADYNDKDVKIDRNYKTLLYAKRVWDSQHVRFIHPVPNGDAAQVGESYFLILQGDVLRLISFEADYYDYRIVAEYEVLTEVLDVMVHSSDDSSQEETGEKFVFSIQVLDKRQRLLHLKLTKALTFSLVHTVDLTLSSQTSTGQLEHKKYAKLIRAQSLMEYTGCYAYCDNLTFLNCDGSQSLAVIGGSPQVNDSHQQKIDLQRHVVWNAVMMKSLAGSQYSIVLSYQHERGFFISVINVAANQVEKSINLPKISSESSSGDIYPLSMSTLTQCPESILIVRQDHFVILKLSQLLNGNVNYKKINPFGDQDDFISCVSDTISTEQDQDVFAFVCQRSKKLVKVEINEDLSMEMYQVGVLSHLPDGVTLLSDRLIIVSDVVSDSTLYRLNDVDDRLVEMYKFMNISGVVDYYLERPQRNISLSSSPVSSSLYLQMQNGSRMQITKRQFTLCKQRDQYNVYQYENVVPVRVMSTSGGDDFIGVSDIWNVFGGAFLALRLQSYTYLFKASQSLTQSGGGGGHELESFEQFGDFCSEVESVLWYTIDDKLCVHVNLQGVVLYDSQLNKVHCFEYKDRIRLASADGASLILYFDYFIVWLEVDLNSRQLHVMTEYPISFAASCICLSSSEPKDGQFKALFVGGYDGSLKSFLLHKSMKFIEDSGALAFEEDQMKIMDRHGGQADAIESIALGQGEDMPFNTTLQSFTMNVYIGTRMGKIIVSEWNHMATLGCLWRCEKVRIAGLNMPVRCISIQGEIFCACGQQTFKLVYMNFKYLFVQLSDSFKLATSWSDKTAYMISPDGALVYGSLSSVKLKVVKRVFQCPADNTHVQYIHSNGDLLIVRKVDSGQVQMSISPLRTINDWSPAFQNLDVGASFQFKACVPFTCADQSQYMVIFVQSSGDQMHPDAQGNNGLALRKCNYRTFLVLQDGTIVGDKQVELSEHAGNLVQVTHFRDDLYAFAYDDNVVIIDKYLAFSSEYQSPAQFIGRMITFATISLNCKIKTIQHWKDDYLCVGCEEEEGLNILQFKQLQSSQQGTGPDILHMGHLEFCASENLCANVDDLVQYETGDFIVIDKCSPQFRSVSEYYPNVSSQNLRSGKIKFMLGGLPVSIRRDPYDCKNFYIVTLTGAIYKVVVVGGTVFDYVASGIDQGLQLGHVATTKKSRACNKMVLNGQSISIFVNMNSQDAESLMMRHFGDDPFKDAVHQYSQVYSFKMRQSLQSCQLRTLF